MKRKIVVVAVTILCLVAFGTLLHSTPSFMDTITGATPKAQKAGKDEARLKGKYLFAMNPSEDELKDEAVRKGIKNIVLGKSETGKSETLNVKFHIYVSDSDHALKKYADFLSKRLKRAGADVKIKEYNNTMLRSRIISGRYQAFIASCDLQDTKSLKKADPVVLDSDEMNDEMKAESSAGRTSDRNAGDLDVMKTRRAKG